jgi:hypothetical protein
MVTDNKSTMYFLFGSSVVLGGLSYLLGIWDRVDFKVRESLLSNKSELVVLVAKCTEKSIGQHVMRLVYGSKKAIDAAHDKSLEMQREAAAAYGVPPGCDSLNVGLFFNDPREPPGPRWAIGWAVVTKDFEEAKDMAKRANEVKTIEEEIVAVRLGGPKQPILTGRIPWRHVLTPMIAPYFYWSKAMDVYTKGGYKSTGNNDDEHEVALEVYVMGPNEKREWIDYVILFGDVKNVWADTGAFAAEAKK